MQGGRWALLWRVPRRWRWLGIPVGGVLAFIAGILFWGSFNWAIEQSSTEAFCISCHEMRDNVYAEYKGTVHDRNRSGVRATCSDCHVPGPWGHKMQRKMQATFNELPKHLFGYLGTREKFDARRLELAQRVWTSMKASDSRECRHCHRLEHMDLELQGQSARTRHAPERQRKNGETCIDCHQGIAHTLPEESDETASD